jgi:glutamine---fructose-6-phosphate transaminase (isomerizing)
MQRAIQKGSKTVAITNVLGSTLYRMADHKLLLNAGPEKAVASTKAYIAKLSALLMLSYAIIGEVKKAQELLLGAAKEVERIAKEMNQYRKLAEKLSKSESIYVLGRGLSYPSSLEGALKIKEVSYIHAEGLAGGELKHGSIALISKGTPVIVFAPNDETQEAILSNAMEVKARGGFIIGISNKKRDVFDHFIEVADLKEATLIAQIIPLQLLAYFLAVSKKFDPDKPRNLAKSVTVK